MATQTALVIKKADGVTNITWTGIAGSAGDKLPAAWRSDSASTLRSNRPVFTHQTQDNGTKTARRSNLKMVFPVTRVINSVETVMERVILDASILVPNALTDAEISEAVQQGINLLGAAQIASAIKAGVADN